MGKHVWTNGNGAGSEKWDKFEEHARFAGSQDDFHRAVAKQPGVPSSNAKDGEPKEGINGWVHSMIGEDNMPSHALS